MAIEGHLYQGYRIDFISKGSEDNGTQKHWKLLFMTTHCVVLHFQWYMNT